MKKVLCIVAGLLCGLLPVLSQSDCFFTHYSSEDGLSQNTVMSILQDRKGNMWFSTWDGINKFDGYTFKIYKADSGNRIGLSNNRIDHLCEDEFGFFWMKTYDDRVFRFDPRMEIFERIPLAGNAEDNVVVSSIQVLTGGSVWLLTPRAGAVHVLTDSVSHQLSLTRYVAGSETFPGTRMFAVYQDKAGNEWMLTDNGLGMLSPGQSQPVLYFTETPKAENDVAIQAFYSAQEHGDEIFFGASRGRVWRYQKADGQFHLLQLPASSPVVAVKSISEHELVMATATDGFYLYDLSTDTWKHYAAERLPRAPIRSIYVDRYSNIWFEQDVAGVVAHFNAQTGVLKTETMTVEQTSTDRSRPAFHVHEDIYGNVWVHPYGGGFSYFDRESNSLRPFYNDMNSPDWRFSNKIHSAYSDRQGNLWIGTHSKGLEKVTFRKSQFSLMVPEPHPYESLSNEVRALAEDRNHNIWVGLKDGKLRVYDRNKQEKGYLTEDGHVAHHGTPLPGNVYYIMQDRKGNLWIATKGDGLVKAEPISEDRYRLTRFCHEEDDIYSLSDNDVYCVYEDGYGRIWVATFAGGINYLTYSPQGNAVFINHRNNLKGFPIDKCYRARFITGDGKGNIWIGTTVGALRVSEDFDTPESAVFHHYMCVPDDAYSLSNNDVHWITATRAGELYLATFGGGLNKLLSIDENGKARFKSYMVRDGLSSDVLLSIREDKKGTLWMSTENGICKFIPGKERFEVYADRRISFQTRFSEAASVYTSGGDMLFGSCGGVFMFNPDSIQESRYMPPIVFSNLLVSNKHVLPKSEGSVLKQILDETHLLKLSHQENIFTIQFAALDFRDPSEIRYAYILEGFEEAWNYVDKQRMAIYTNLPKGHYTFKVRSTNADGVWVDNTRTLFIEVMPSFWETPYAYCLYVLVILAVIISAVYILFTIYRLKHQVAMEQQMTNMKLRFFTDISHELRTPLTLISGPLGYVLANKKLPADAREQLQVVERNTGRMLRLINQILDFRKIQNRKMKLQVQRINVVPFTRRIMRNFLSEAEEHRIDFLFETETEELYLWVDADKFEKIVFNLLSNAFKYTPDGKMIKVFIREDEESVSVGVQDQGIGIEENKKKTIFMRFENLVNHNLFSPSTGIGLSLVKELVEMHHAVIDVDSKVGEGSIFWVTFHKGKEHYDDSVEFLQDDNTAAQTLAEHVAVDIERGLSPQAESDEDDMLRDRSGATRDIMLLVEDNYELRLFLRSIFTADYNVVEASDGKEGLEKAQKFVPDIIISDVMMPGMDGIEMIQLLRSDITTSHIPVILLTAKSSVESKLQGLQYGADDYLTKPFSATYLEARVKSLLARRKTLQERYRQDIMTASPSSVLQEDEAVDQPSTPELSPADQCFMDRLLELMEKNMDNGELVVDDLVRELAVSRSVFFKKLKMLTGLAPIEFIKEMRINRAAQLIDTGEFTMTQISYMVGINDPRYFSKCFKQKMGMTPTDYRDRKKNNPEENQ